jgi:hypothetical protein
MADLLTTADFNMSSKQPNCLSVLVTDQAPCDALDDLLELICGDVDHLEYSEYEAITGVMSDYAAQAESFYIWFDQA